MPPFMAVFSGSGKECPHECGHSRPEACSTVAAQQLKVFLELKLK